MHQLSLVCLTDFGLLKRHHRAFKSIFSIVSISCMRTCVRSSPATMRVTIATLNFHKSLYDNLIMPFAGPVTASSLYNMLIDKYLM